MFRNLAQTLMTSVKAQLLLGLVIGVLIGGVIILSGHNSGSQIQRETNGVSQSPMQYNNSTAASGQLQANGVDLQSSAAVSSPISPDSASQPPVQSNGNTSSGTPSSTQPSNGQTQSAPQSSYPPCYYCKPGAGHVCPMVATSYPCSCNGMVETQPNDNIACMQQ